MKLHFAWLAPLLLAVLPAQAIDFGTTFGGDSATAEDGTFEHGSGTLSARILIVGKNKTAVVTQSGGTVRIEEITLLGYNAGASGSYMMSGGLHSTLDLFVGENGAGNWFQNGGTTDVRRLLRIRDRFTLLGQGNVAASDGTQLFGGTLQMSGGSLFSDLDMRGGAWNFYGGLLRGKVTQNGGRVDMRAGTLSGDLNLVGGYFAYRGGNLFGHVTLGPAVYAGTTDDFIPWAPLTLPGGMTIKGTWATENQTTHGSGLDNQGTFTFSGTLDGSGLLRNRGTMNLMNNPRIDGTGGFVNEGQFKVQPWVNLRGVLQPINPVLSKTGTNRNTGTMDLGPSVVRFTLEGDGQRLDNTGLITMQGATVDGNGLLSNEVGGELRGWGRIKSRFVSIGLMQVQGGALGLDQTWVNRGEVRVDAGAWLDGARIDNRGVLRAAGVVRAEVLNIGLVQLGNATQPGSMSSRIVNQRGGVLRIGLDSPPPAGTQVLDTYLTGDIDNRDGGRIEIMPNRIAHFEGELQLRDGSVLDLRSAFAYFDGHTVLTRGVQLLGTGGKALLRGTLSFAADGTFISDPGRYWFAEGSTLRFGLQSLAGGLRASHLDVGGNLLLGNGRLQLTLGGNTPVRAGMHVDLLDWGSLIGRFGSFDVSGAVLPDGLRWDFDRLYTNGEVWISAVSEPAAWLQLLAGAGLLGLLARRRLAS